MMNLAKSGGMSATVYNSMNKFAEKQKPTITTIEAGSTSEVTITATQVNDQIETIRELLTSHGWKPNKSNFNMLDGSSVIEFDHLDGLNGPIFDINLYDRVSSESDQFLGTISGFNSKGQPFPAQELVKRVISSF